MLPRRTTELSCFTLRLHSPRAAVLVVFTTSLRANALFKPENLVDKVLTASAVTPCQAPVCKFVTLPKSGNILLIGLRKAPSPCHYLCLGIHTPKAGPFKVPTRSILNTRRQLVDKALTTRALTSRQTPD